MEARRAERLYQKANAARWQVPVEVFTNALERSAEKAAPAGDVDRFYESLHLEDLALACACAIGREEAWDHFVLEFRPAMYRAADAIDPGGGAREVAEALYAELFGLRERDGIRQSVFRYFHGRSSLATWLRSLIAQRWVDRHRAGKRLEPLPEESSAAPLHSQAVASDPNRARYISAMRTVLAAAIAALPPRDRLRLACYYAQEMTLAQIAKLTREHEATVSRHLAKTRRALRDDVEHRLLRDHGFAAAQVEECFASVMDDSGNLDLAEWLDAGGSKDPAEVRKKSEVDRSMTEETS